MNLLVPVTLFGWIPVAIALFVLLPGRRAVIVAFLLAWLFLPMAGYDLPGLPPYTKMTATSYGVLLGVVLFDAQRLMSFRPALVDVPMAVWCVVPFASSLSNGLGLYDGCTAMLAHIFEWGMPYLIGRLYFSDLEGLRELAIGIFIAGLVYVPFCLWEIRLSPRLHYLVYGFKQHDFSQTMRFGGWRPMVFMQHGLAVSLFMATASLLGYWLWRTRALRRLWNIPTLVLAWGLMATTVLCKSVLAILLMFAGLLVLETTRKLRIPLAALCLIAIPPTYMLARTGGWSAGGLVAVAELIDQDRAQSLQRRIRSETALTEKSLQRPLVGWGKWGRFLVKNEEGRKEGIIPDGFWLAALGSHGVVGLVSVTLAILLPGLLLLRRFPARFWGCREIGPAAALAVALTLWMSDNLLNAMPNPVFLLAAGGLSGLWLLRSLSPEAQRGLGRSAVGGPSGIQAGDRIDRDPGTGLVRVRW